MLTRLCFCALKLNKLNISQGRVLDFNTLVYECQYWNWNKGSRKRNKSYRENSCLYTLQAIPSLQLQYIYYFFFLISKEIISNASEKKLSKLINPTPQVQGEEGIDENAFIWVHKCAWTFMKHQK